jgi:hypothetical protein
VRSQLKFRSTAVRSRSLAPLATAHRARAFALDHSGLVLRTRERNSCRARASSSLRSQVTTPSDLVLRFAHSLRSQLVLLWRAARAPSPSCCCARAWAVRPSALLAQCYGVRSLRFAHWSRAHDVGSLRSQLDHALRALVKARGSSALASLEDPNFPCAVRFAFSGASLRSSRSPILRLAALLFLVAQEARV